MGLYCAAFLCCSKPCRLGFLVVMIEYRGPLRQWKTAQARYYQPIEPSRTQLAQRWESLRLCESGRVPPTPDCWFAWKVWEKKAADAPCFFSCREAPIKQAI